MGFASFFQWKQAPSVRTSLLILVLGCVLPIAAVAAFLIVNFYHKEQTRLISNTIGRARSIITAVDRDFGSTEAALQALGTSRQLQQGDLQGFHGRAIDALQNLQADSIVIVDTSGALLLSTRRPFGEALPRLARAPLLQRILASGKPGVSDLFTAPLDGQLIYTIGVPIRRNGAIAMTLNATAVPARLSRILTEQKLPPGWRAAIVDSQGRIVARSHDIQKFLGRQLGPELLQPMAQSDEAGFESVTLDGIPVFTVYSRSAGSRWTAILGMPLDELTAGLRRTLAWLIVATLAALGAGLALAWRIGGGITRSVHALIPPALAVGAGAVLPIPPLHFKEANELGRTLLNAATSVRQAWADTRESEQRLALAAQAAHLGIWIRDLQRHEIWVSDPWRALFGFSATQPIALDDLLQRVHPDDRAAVRQTLDDARHGTPRYEMEYRIELPDGTLRWIGSHGSVEADAQGRPALVRGVSLDITQRKQAELGMQQKQKEVMHLSRVAVLGELSGALAHELNQPLTAILSNAQAAQRFLGQQNVDLDEVREILQDIVDEDKRAGEIIRRLRRLFDKNETPRQRVEINALVLGVLQLLRNDLINHGVTLATELTAISCTVSADSVQLQQVLINLLMNACDAMAAQQRTDGAIIVRTALLPDARVGISIVDCGGGIAPAALERVFDPFYTTKESGMGLGLSICRNIIGAHEGQLWAENNAQRGATFYICLPLIGPEPS
ncbi:MAG: ATP-binding protein [Pseudomonadota bacterium]